MLIIYVTIQQNNLHDRRKKNSHPLYGSRHVDGVSGTYFVATIDIQEGYLNEARISARSKRRAYRNPAVTAFQLPRQATVRDMRRRTDGPRAMTAPRELTPQLHSAVLRDDMTLEQGFDEPCTPIGEQVERVLDGKPTNYSASFAVWPRKPQATESSQAEVQRLAPEKAVARGLQLPAVQLDAQQIPVDQGKRIARLERRLGELEQIVVDLTHRLAATGVA